MRNWVAKCIARAFLAHWGDGPAMVARARRTLGYDWVFLEPLVAELLKAERRRPTLAQLKDRVAADPYFRSAAGFPGRLDPHTPEPLDPDDLALLQLGIRVAVQSVPVVQTRMEGLPRFPVPVFDNPAALLATLHLDDGVFRHLAAPGAGERNRPPGPLRNYRYHWRGERLIEAPKERLKQLQRWIDREILRQIPADDAAHGFVRGRSILTHARVHAGTRVVLRLDLAAFFPSISGARVQALFRAVGYPESVARSLMMLTTHRTPADVLAQASVSPALGSQLAHRHLPQGAPSSPAIANLCAYALDRRLLGLAQRFGAHYSRYADDLCFSGGPELLRRAEAFAAWVAYLAHQEGFRINHRKTRVMPQAQRQRVTGLVVNQRPNTPRREYELLRAILHNAARHGPESQNRAAHPDFRRHLQGRIAFVAQINPERGARLLAQFQNLSWPP